METTSRGGTNRAQRRSRTTRAAPRNPSTAICGPRSPGTAWTRRSRGTRWLIQVGLSAEGTVEHGSLGPRGPADPQGDAADGGTRTGHPAVRGGRHPRQPARTAQRGRHRHRWRPPRSPRGVAGRFGTALLHLARAGWTAGCARTGWTSRPRSPGNSPTTWRVPTGRTLTLPVDGIPTPFRYRESEYGWVLAGSAPGVHVGAYGRGMSPYGLGLGVVRDITAYRG